MFWVTRTTFSSTYRRSFSTCSRRQHENPLGLPRNTALPPPTIPRRGLPQKRSIPHVKNVVVVASGKGGVGKSTVAANLAIALAMNKPTGEGHPDHFAVRRPRVGLLDLDLFGPSIPKLMGLENAEEPMLTRDGALVPLTNHGIPCMSMDFLLPSPPSSNPSSPSAAKADTPVIWRGLMVQKAVQQLLFDVDWREGASDSKDSSGPGLDVLVIDMPPGTGDVPLTVGQLINVDGAVIVSTPQDVSLSDVRKGIAMFRKISIPITGLLLNTAHFTCPCCNTRHELFGSAESFRSTAKLILGGGDQAVLGELPLVPEVSRNGDAGVPFMLISQNGLKEKNQSAGQVWQSSMASIANRVWKSILEDK